MPSGHDQPHAFRSQHANTGGPGSIEHALAKRGLAAMLIIQLAASGQHQRSPYATLAKAGKQLRQAIDRSAQNRQIDDLG